MARRSASVFEQKRVEGPTLRRVERDAGGRDGDVEPVAREVMRLQRSGGNDAVSALLVQRDETAPVEADAGKKKPTTATLVLDGVAEGIPLIGFTIRDNDVEVSTEYGTSTKELFRLAAANAKIEHATISTSSGYTVALKNLHIMSVKASSGGTGTKHRAHDDDVDILFVKFAYETRQTKRREKPKTTNDDWTAH